MFVAMYATVLFLVAARACASCGDSTLAPDPTFKVLFMALKTGVLEVSARFDVSWLQGYVLSLTEESINKFENLLFNGATDASQHDSERSVPSPISALTARDGDQAHTHANASPRSRAATRLQDALVRMMEGGTSHEKLCLRVLLAKYAFYKVWLHKELGPAESQLLDISFSAIPVDLRFIHRLISAKDRSGLLLAFADSYESAAVGRVWLELKSESPHVIATLIRKYVENHEHPVKIPLDLFKGLTLECQYRLATKLADLRPYYEEVDWYSFYVLSRFSAQPSERIRALCLKKDVRLLKSEREKTHESNRAPADIQTLNPHVVVDEVWFKIILHLDELSHIYIVPGVCRLWREFSSKILNESLAIHVARARELNGPAKWDRILDNECYPWNRPSSSRVASFKWLASQLSDGIESSEVICRKMEAAWDLICRDIGEGWIKVSHELYLDLYVCCCRAIRYPPEFRQLPGMSDEEYVSLIEGLVYQYNIIPALSNVLLDDNCDALVKMLENHGDLAVLLLRDKPYYYNKLVTQLLSNKLPIPPKVADILAKKSSFYNFLLNRRENVEKCLGIVPLDFATRWYSTATSYSVIDLCLSIGPQGDSITPKLMGEIVQYFCGPNAGEGTKHRQLMQLGIDILKFLCDNRKNYSIEELETIERFVEECRIYGEEDDQNILGYVCESFLRNSLFTIKLTG